MPLYRFLFDFENLMDFFGLHGFKTSVTKWPFLAVFSNRASFHDLYNHPYSITIYSLVVVPAQIIQNSFRYYPLPFLLLWTIVQNQVTQRQGRLTLRTTTSLASSSAHKNNDNNVKQLSSPTLLFIIHHQRTRPWQATKQWGRVVVVVVIIFITTTTTWYCCRRMA